MLVLTNTHMLKKIKNLCEQNFKDTVAQPTVTAKELNSRQKEKPQGKKKNKEKPHAKKKNLRAKRKTHGKKNSLTAKEKRIKNVLSASKKFGSEFFYFYCEVFPFAVRFFFAVRLLLLP